MKRITKGIVLLAIAAVALSTRVYAQPGILLKETFEEGKVSGKLFGGHEFVMVGGSTAVNLTSLTSAVGYPGRILSGKEGTIEFWWMPPQGFVEFYTERRPEWKDYSFGGKVYKPPTGGFLLDQIAWFAAKPGCFLLELSFSKDGGTATLRWGVWDGRKWQDARWKHDPSFWVPGRWYHIAVSYGPRGLRLYVNFRLRAENTEYRGGLYREYVFYLGQNQNTVMGRERYWPYGPHTMMGCYDDLVIWNKQLHFTQLDIDLPERMTPGEYQVSGKLPEPAALAVTVFAPSGAARRFTVETGEDGAYVFTLDFDAPGTWSVVVEAYLAKSMAFIRGEKMFTVKRSSTISLKSSEDIELQVGNSYKVAGAITPNPGGGQEVLIVYTSPGGERRSSLAVTDSDGKFTDEFTPDEEGEWRIEASWEGNDTSWGASTSIVIEVKGKPEAPYTLVFVILGAVVAILIIVLAARRRRRPPLPPPGWGAQSPPPFG